MFSCAGLFEAVVRREVPLNQVGSTGLRDGRVLLSTGEDQSENPPAINATQLFVMAAQPYDAAATRIQSRGEAEVDTFELASGAAKTPLGTSSSPVVGKMGQTLSLGGVCGTANGKVYAQFLRPGIERHCELRRFIDSNAVASTLFSLVNSAAASSKPSFFDFPGFRQIL